jgi:hypothetical protein
VAGLGQPRPAPSSVTAERTYYSRCPNFHFHGTHKLFRHALSCPLAKGKSIYVLRYRKHPPGWRCSLGSLQAGYGACARGARAFEFLPV